jgi:hypothetical protein
MAAKAEAAGAAGARPVVVVVVRAKARPVVVMAEVVLSPVLRRLHLLRSQIHIQHSKQSRYLVPIFGIDY